MTENTKKQQLNLVDDEYVSVDETYQIDAKQLFVNADVNL